jgi:D-amino-acid dehydrogenase
VYESARGFARDAAEWDLKRTHGIEALELSGGAARELEPALGPIVTNAVLTPQWSIVGDPKRVVDGLRLAVTQRGATVLSASVTAIEGSAEKITVITECGQRFGGDAVVVAAGVWSARLATTCGDRVSLESERGYNVTFPRPDIKLVREIIFAERKFVASPLDCGLRVGGAAEFGGLNSPADYRRSWALAELAKRYLPELNTIDGKPWAGHRPTTPDSLPVIGQSARQPRVYYAFGHGHLGLTLAATTGRLISDLIQNRPTPIEVAPYSIERFM